MIEVRGLSFTYPKSKKPAIHNLHFQTAPGEIFGFLGPSGAGKSTTQKILIGLIKNFGGIVTVFGKELSTWDSGYYERIGIGFEFPNHFLKLTGFENLKYFSKLYSKTESPADLLRLVGLESAANVPVSQYSKGMKVRLSFVRALLHRPELLFLDEPTAGLDPVNARHLKELIRAQKREGRTVFLTTHDMGVADELCDRVAFLVDGEIKIVDRPDELKLRFGQTRVRCEFENHGGEQSVKEYPLQGLADNSDFIVGLRENNLRTIHSLEATLEEVFIQITGRDLT
jgi:fluoroquinolone transport system ATP-binding protein